MLGAKPTGAFVLGYEITIPQVAVISDLVVSSQAISPRYKLGFRVTDRVISSEKISIANIWTQVADDAATVWTVIA